LLDKIFAEEGTRLAQPVTDLVALFGRLKRRGLALGVATSDSHASACSNLARLRLSDLVDFVAGYDSGYGGKPGPGMVRGFCAATRLAAAEVMVVGDNRHDLEMGRSARAGLVVGVLSGTGSRKALAPYADRLIKSVDELEPLLDGRMPADEPAG
jgi:phosphoglycolate phosphatase